MLRIRIGWIALIVAAPVLASFSPAPAAGLQQDKEPPLVIYLEGGGKKTPVELDKPFELETKAGKTSFTLRMEPYRIFQYAGLYFHYPRGASFKAQAEGPMTLWNLTDGNNVLMVQHFKGQSDPNALLKLLVDQMVAQYGTTSGVKQVEATLELQKKQLKGIRLEVAIAQQTIHQSLFSFGSGKDTIVLILQDAPEEGGKTSGSFMQFRKVFSDSFRFPAK